MQALVEGADRLPGTLNMYEQGSGRINLLGSMKVLAVSTGACSAALHARAAHCPCWCPTVLSCPAALACPTPLPRPCPCRHAVEPLLLTPLLSNTPAASLHPWALQEYQPRASVIPAELDLSKGPYSWPYFQQVRLASLVQQCCLHAV